MTTHLLAGSLLLALLATTLLGQLAREPMVQPAVATVRQATTTPGPGFAGVFGRGAAVRNLIF